MITSTAPGGARVVVDLAAIRSSVATLVAAAAPALVMAVVKADGYGHGLVPSARAALAGGAGWLGTAALEEALALRAGGIEAPVLSWLNPPQAPFAAAVAAGVDLAVSAPWAVEAVVTAARQADRTARLHLKVDTGLARNGATLADWPALVRAAAAAAASGEVEVVGAMSHFVLADDPAAPLTGAQVRRFAEALEVAARLGVRPPLRHLANSAATLARPDTHLDLVRPGLACYGLSPLPGRPPAELGLHPAMTLTAPVALTKRVAAGQGVSYGHRWHAPGDTGLALVPLGYADGVPRAATNLGEVLLAGRRRRIAGTVCMDQFVVDVGEDRVEPGEEVILFGPGGRGEPTAQEWAERTGTISYEIVTRLGSRLPRVYIGDDAERPVTPVRPGTGEETR